MSWNILYDNTCWKFPPTLTAEKRETVSKLLLHIKESVFSSSLTSWMTFQSLRKHQTKSFLDKKLLSAACSWGSNFKFCGGNSFFSLCPEFQLLHYVLLLLASAQSFSKCQNWAAPVCFTATAHISLEENMLSATSLRKQYKIITYMSCSTF